jgi:N-acetylglucosaminyl-diphospho-decaprenol L-rhamnosyltransferase
MATSLGIVIVNYRTASLAVDCLRSLVPEVASLPGTRVVVVDGASGDGSVEKLVAAVAAEDWGDWVRLLPLQENRGFSAGNNAGIRLLLADPEPPSWILLLNPDTVVRSGALAALLRRAVDRPRTGVVGSRLEDPDGTPQSSAFRFFSILGEVERGFRLRITSWLLSRWAVVLPQPREACQVGWVSGASLMVRREVLETVGLMDEGYFLYCEEVDLCLQAARAGWECWHESESRVIHLGGQSTGIDPTDTSRRPPAYVFESRRRYFVKNHGRAYAALADLGWLGAHLIWRVRARLRRPPQRAAPGLLSDFIRHSALVRSDRP